MPPGLAADMCKATRAELGVNYLDGALKEFGGNFGIVDADPMGCGDPGEEYVLVGDAQVACSVVLTDHCPVKPCKSSIVCFEE